MPPGLMVGYRAQYARMLRYLKVAKRPSADTLTKEDDCITFFLHCWHLRDHVRKDPAVAQGVWATVDAAVRASAPLQVVENIANGMKHLTAYPARMRGHNDLHVFVSAVGSDTPAYSETHPLVTFDDGSQRRAVEVAVDAASEWTRILTEAGLPL